MFIPLRFTHTHNSHTHIRTYTRTHTAFTTFTRTHAHTCTPVQLTQLLFSGSTVEELFDTMKDMHLLSGDFIRAECRDKDGSKKPIRKDETITEDNRIIRIMTNKKSVWQKLS